MEIQKRVNDSQAYCTVAVTRKSGKYPCRGSALQKSQSPRHFLWSLSVLFRTLKLASHQLLRFHALLITHSLLWQASASLKENHHLHTYYKPRKPVMTFFFLFINKNNIEAEMHL